MRHEQGLHATAAEYEAAAMKTKPGLDQPRRYFDRICYHLIGENFTA